MQPVNIIGNRYGRLEVIGRSDKKNSDGSYRWVCRCDCGNTKEFAKANLDGKGRRPTKSCGCLAAEYSVAITSHGMTETPEYDVWLNMRKRCNWPAAANYSSYGGRGITICKAWDDFETFIKDVGLRPTPHHSIGRVNNDGNYEPSNVEWQTDEQQSRNTSRTVNLKIAGQVMCMKDWANLLSINYDTLKSINSDGARIDYILQKHPEEEIRALLEDYLDVI